MHKHRFTISWTDCNNEQSIEADHIIIKEVDIKGWNTTNIEIFDGTTTRFLYLKKFTVQDNYKE